MATENQLAIARQTRGASTHLSKTARKVVPRFLQKLYEIVNDPETDDLIRWNEIGDSFYVLDSTRLAKEVFEKWFKHNNFSSFVRQLNMYGFHKIPLLQQGVLRSDTDTELWNFEHPHFRRGQPDMLCLIQRKKQPTGQTRNPDEQPIPDLINPIQPPPLTHNVPGGQVLDVNSLVTGISAIKRHQQAISADLNELKTSNQHLWQEAMAARERHKKHQDTINRILKFLAGVFGHSATSPVHKRDDSESPHPVVPRKRQRLMIADADIEKSKGATVADDEDDDEVMEDEAPSPTPFATIATPTASDVFSPAPTPATLNDQPPWPESNPSNAAPSALTAFSPNRKGSPNTADLQTAFNQMMSSPDQMQRLLQALSQSNFPIQSSPTSNNPPSSSNEPESEANNQLQPWAPQFNYDTTSHPEDVNPNCKILPLPSAKQSPPPLLPPTLNTSQPEDLMPLFQEHGARLQNTWKDASHIAANVDLMDSNIKSFIEDLRFDPSLFEQSNTHGAALPGTENKPGPSDGQGTFNAVPNGADGEMDFGFDDLFPLYSRDNENGLNYDDLSHQLSSSAAIEDGETDQLTAFLDEVASDTASIRQHSPEAPLSRRKKRKSDVADILDDIDPTKRIALPQKSVKRNQ